MKQTWVKTGNTYLLGEVSNQLDKLPIAVYKLEIDPKFGPKLVEAKTKFEFPYKIYGVEDPFINRMVKSYTQTTGNFGCILNGVKGTGKSVTAERICNELNLPVILIGFYDENIVSFLNSLSQDVVVFIDEYEKIFKSYENTLLSVMDGAMVGNHRICFILTTNDLTIDRNLVQRPGRIRYIKTFEDLSIEVIMEVVDEELIHKEFREETIKMISELPLITMDLVRSIISEVNIHNEDPNNFKDVLNIHDDKMDLYDVYEEGKEGQPRKLIKSGCKIVPSFIYDGSVGDYFRAGNENVGTITGVVDKHKILVESWEDDPDDENKPEIRVSKIIILDPISKTHKAFRMKGFSAVL